MKLKLLGTAALALGMLSAPAIAQEAPTTPPMVDESAAGGNDPADTNTTQSIANGTYASDTERAWYQENAGWLGQYFTDESMGTMKSDEDVKQIFSAMGAEDQAGMKAACQKAASDRGNYGSVTLGLCSAAGVM